MGSLLLLSLPLLLVAAYPVGASARRRHERPRSVILEPPVLSGGRYTLRCHVTHVFPVGFLMVTLRHGGRIIYFESLERFKDLDPANVTLTYTFRARTSDLRQPVTCHARLTLDGLVVRSSSAPVILTALERPDRVELVPLPPWQPVGENFTLSCRVPGAGPRASLTLTLLRGAQELIRRSFTGEPPRARGAVLTATVLARREDHGANFSCRAELDLQPHGLGLFENTSAPRQLRTFEAGVYLALGDQRLNPDVTLEGDTLRATATATGSAEQEGARQLVCNVTLGGESREAQENVTVYRFPAPLLTLSQPSAPEGQMVTVTCTAGTQALVTLEGIPAAAPGQPAQLQLNATENDDGRGFVCYATLEVDGETLSKNGSTELRVLYVPALDSVGCPDRITWVEGTEASLSCVAHGVPAPDVSCVRSGEAHPVEGLLRVAREHAGTYHCEATNTLGSTAKTVAITVEYGPRFEERGCPSNWTWVEGSGSLFSCEVDGKPQPSVECVGSEDANEGVVLPLVSSKPGPRAPSLPSDLPAGVYVCNATNPHGSSVKTVVVSAEYRPVVAELAASPPSVRPGGNFTLTCRAEAWPPAQISWRAPPGASNIGLSSNNSTLSVAGALGSHGGEYECAATNAHGRHARRITVRVADRDREPRANNTDRS
ncbi:Intercellular adhesion molecule 5 [Fukomys damarensis]|uniref:Intercellular adhesion molecule 5 n=1 Tax=Fukomys damarensis TaxID=885580 RepID=A0A091DCH5_FUKDA|nr:Intercellular adhesion molecule 5 [Fukomys damarensis]